MAWLRELLARLRHEAPVLADAERMAAENGRPLSSGVVEVRRK